MILCCGEALIDMIPKETTSGQLGFVPYPGGSVFNTAIALGRLGADVALCAGLSEDLFGDILRDALAESRVKPEALIRAPHPTTLAFVHLTDGQARYSFFDENSAGRMLSLDQLPGSDMHADILFFGGISLVNAPAADSFASLAQREAGRKLIMLDPNIRPAFITDEPAYRARLDQMIAAVDIVKISDEDLQWLDRSDRAIEDKATALLEAGPRLVLLTCGGDGVIALSETLGRLHVPAPEVEVIDTVGAGDTFTGGFLAELTTLGHGSRDGFESLTSDALEQCLSFAARVAAVTVSRAGANPPWRAEL